MKFAKQADFNLKCVFNDINKSNINLLAEEIDKAGYSDFIKGYYCKDANIVY